MTETIGSEDTPGSTVGGDRVVLLGSGLGMESFDDSSLLTQVTSGSGSVVAHDGALFLSTGLTSSSQALARSPTTFSNFDVSIDVKFNQVARDGTSSTFVIGAYVSSTTYCTLFIDVSPSAVELRCESVVAGVYLEDVTLLSVSGTDVHLRALRFRSSVYFYLNGDEIFVADWTDSPANFQFGLVASSDRSGLRASVTSFEQNSVVWLTKDVLQSSQASQEYVVVDNIYRATGRFDVRSPAVDKAGSYTITVDNGTTSYDIGTPFFYGDAVDFLTITDGDDDGWGKVRVVGDSALRN